MTEPDICLDCNARGVITLATHDLDGVPKCENCADNANEAAYERSLSDFYGGSSPQSDRERMSQAYTLHERQRGR